MPKVGDSELANPDSWCHPPPPPTLKFTFNNKTPLFVYVPFVTLFVRSEVCVGRPPQFVPDGGTLAAAATHRA